MESCSKAILMQLHYYFNVSKLQNVTLKIDNIGLCIGDCSVSSQRAVVRDDDQEPLKSFQHGVYFLSRERTA